MPEKTLKNLLSVLSPPSSATFSIVEASSSPRSYAGIDKDGRPALLVETSNETSREVVRRGLRLQHRATCHVVCGGRAQTIRASLVVCESHDPSMHEAFISVGEIILSRLSNASEAEVVAILEELVELLERPGVPSREGAIGLFAELLVLSLARDPYTAVKSWRITETDRYDLVRGTGRIEVKASGNRERRHHFALEQCVPDAGTKVFVASTLIVESPAGITVRDLASRLKERVKLDANLTMKIERAVIATIGLPRTNESSFDEAHAHTKLRWYDVEAIPAIKIAPDGVDQVRFRVDLDSIDAVALGDIEIREPSIEPCLPAS